MANQNKSKQAKKVEAMGAKSGATKAQVAQGLARAGGKSAYNVTNKDVKRAGKAAKIIAGAAVTAVGPGKVVKAVKTAKAVAKTASKIAEPKSAVKVIRANSKGIPNSVFNKIQTSASKKIKSGENAKNRAREDASEIAYLKMMNKEKTKTIKIK
jgi:hypothetical protein